MVPMEDQRDVNDGDTALRAEVVALRRELAELRSLVLRERPIPDEGEPGPRVVTSAEAVQPGFDPAVDRRTALRRGAGLAAAAVAGSAAIVAGTASPAAAATVAGSGNPGVSGTGVGGHGVNGTTDTANQAGVRGTTSTTDAIGVIARHTGAGRSLYATGNGAPVAQIESLTGSDALQVDSGGYAAVLTGGTGPYGTLKVYASGGSSAVYVDQSGSGAGISISGPPSGIAISAVTANVGAFLAGDTAIRLATHLNHIELDPSNNVPTTRATAAKRGTVTYDGTDLWFCTVAGTPGTWRKLAATAGAGTFHLLDAPARAYDSRAGTLPAVGSKTPLSANVARAVDLRANNTGVPAGATGVMVTLLLVNAANGNGNITVWKNGAAKPAANTLVWGGSAGRFAITAVTAVDANGLCQLSASLGTDIVVDVVGYYR